MVIAALRLPDMPETGEIERPGVDWRKFEAFPDWEFSAGTVRHSGCRKVEPGQMADTWWNAVRCVRCGETIPQALRRAALNELPMGS
jgi:hypothetical protein